MTGSQHTKLTLAITAVSFPALLVYGISLPDSIRASAGIALTVMVGPDLDVDKGNISIEYIRRILPPLAWAWRLFWLPYGKIMAHRGPSHIPVIGTASRVIYVLLFVWAIQAVLYQPPFIPGRDHFVIMAGMAAGDFFHATADLISTLTKGRE